MSRRRAASPSPRPVRAGRSSNRSNDPRRRLLLAVTGLAILSVVALAAWAMLPADSSRLERQARQAADARDWDRAADLLARRNARDDAPAESLLAEARAQLARNHAREAELALRRATAADPRLAEAWLLILEILRLEDRQPEALRIGREAEAAVDHADRLRIRRALTLALLADAPDHIALPTLRSWAEADPDDLDSHLALIARQAQTGPRGAGPVAARAAARVVSLEDLLARNPRHIGVRAAVISALAEAGQIDRGRELLDSWLSEDRDLRYDRLRGRWDLEYDHRPAEAVASFERVLAGLPHDWKTRTRLARALHAVGRDADARAQADIVARHGEIVRPDRLGARLSHDLERQDDPTALDDLARLCDSLGLSDLATSWREEAATARLARATLGDRKIPAPGGK